VDRISSGCDPHYGFDTFISRNPDRELQRLGSLRVKRQLKKDWGCITGKDSRKQRDGLQVHGVWWPPLEKLRAMFEQKYAKQEWLVTIEKTTKQSDDNRHITLEMFIHNIDSDLDKKRSMPRVQLSLDNNLDHAQWVNLQDVKIGAEIANGQKEVTMRASLARRFE
jgi:hypothetical protein